MIEPGELGLWFALQAALRSAVDDGQSIPCRGPDAALWSSRHRDEREAACWRCQTCPVLTDCRAWALTVHELSGVWGGVDPIHPSRKEPR